MGNKFKYSPILILIIFLGAYPITKFMYEDMYIWCEINLKLIKNPYVDIWNDWYLNIIFISLSISLYINHKHINSFWSNIGFKLSIMNLVDAICFDLYKFTKSDVIMLVPLILTSYYKYVCKKK